MKGPTASNHKLATVFSWESSGMVSRRKNKSKKKRRFFFNQIKVGKDASYLNTQGRLKKRKAHGKVVEITRGKGKISRALLILKIKWREMHIVLDSWINTHHRILIRIRSR